MAFINSLQLEEFFNAVGERCEPSSTLYLLGGGALVLLNGSRPTMDLDYVGHDLNVNSLQVLMAQIATEMQIELEAVPIDEFVPLPKNAHQRAIFVGHFGELSVYIFDPYTIALSKLDRGFEADLDDIAFLIQEGIVLEAQLEAFMQVAAQQAAQYSLDAAGMHRHLEVVRQLLQ